MFHACAPNGITVFWGGLPCPDGTQYIYVHTAALKKYRDRLDKFFLFGKKLFEVG
jgi:hypothetical protein